MPLELEQDESTIANRRVRVGRMDIQAIYGTKYIRPVAHGSITLDFGPPLKWWERAIQATITGLMFGTLGVLVVIAAMANPELFGAVFGASFGIAIISLSRR